MINWTNISRVLFIFALALVAIESRAAAVTFSSSQVSEPLPGYAAACV